ncbi:GTPase regulator Vps3 [Schizosaccharomyces cryophilus OY26]|uniref:GTPase regulator Vps3 n=1 Tax=Schizosaccharomyces cryophilus (strain OY26 / ATCC MYA-4695 / CBS 11777 / NBRC 106824 / NRRL Y48691) TaxID=653667 RepID=S9VUV0_SCHCR|nr:GTPase regulator Vps3 [Schizosaccharomyces cryophilus OY26]EPY49954.1 GTPase regulator Vps3 [Schizosaccharomyces cryophilus OY26]
MSDIYLSSYELDSELKDQISTIALHDGHAYFGTKQGGIFFYEYSELRIKNPCKFLKSAALPSKSPVKRIFCVPFLEAILVHQDDRAVFYHATNLDFVYPSSSLDHLVEISHEGHFIEEKSTYLVVTSSHIQLVSLQLDGTFFLRNELKYPNVQTATLLGKTVCLVTDQSFELVDILTGENIPLFPIIKNDSESHELSYKPMIVSQNNEFLLITGSPKDAIGLFVDMNGNVTKSTLTFSFYPKDVVATSHYVFALAPNMLQIIDIQTLRLVKNLAFDGENQIFSFISPASNTYFCDEKILKKFSLNHKYESLSEEVPSEATKKCCLLKPIILFASKNAWGFGTESSFFERLEMTITSGEIESPLRRLSKRLKYPEKYHVDHDAAALQYIYLEQMAALQYWKQGQYENSLSLLETSKIDPRVIISLYPDVFDDRIAYVTFQGIQEFLVTFSPVDEAIVSMLSLNDLFRETDEYTQKQMIEITKENAYIMLMRYLKNYKRNVNLFEYFVSLKSDIAVVVDHVLLKLYLSMEDIAEGTKNAEELIESGLANPDDIERLLSGEQETYLLVILLMNLHKDSETLELWKKLILGEMQDKRSRNEITKLRNCLMKDIDLSLFWKYTNWLCAENADEGTKLLLDKTLSGSVSGDDVLNNLDPANDSVLIEYLVKSNTISHRGLLLELCVNKLLDGFVEHEEFRARLEDLIENYRKLPCLPKPIFAQYLDTQFGYMNDCDSRLSFYYLYSISLIENMDQEAISKFEVVLQQGSSKELGLFPQLQHRFFHKKGDYEKALAVLIECVYDYKGAELYCQQIESVYSSCWNTLLEKSISTGPSCIVYVKDLLYRRASYYSLSFVISTIPDDWNLSCVANYLCVLQRKNAQRLHESHVKTALAKSISREAESLFLAVNRRNVTLKKPPNHSNV